MTKKEEISNIITFILVNYKDAIKFLEKEFLKLLDKIRMGEQNNLDEAVKDFLIKVLNYYKTVLDGLVALFVRSGNHNVVINTDELIAASDLESVDRIIRVIDKIKEHINYYQSIIPTTK
jgi:hypothetical protein